MPKTKVLFYREQDGSVPLLQWFEGLPAKCIARCQARLERLEQSGHELRRPEADYLEEGIYELRTRLGSVNYRLLYFFHGREAVVISHGLSKQQAKVPVSEIDLALRRKRDFETDPDKHTCRTT